MRNFLQKCELPVIFPPKEKKEVIIRILTSYKSHLILFLAGCANSARTVRLF